MFSTTVLLLSTTIATIATAKPIPNISNQFYLKTTEIDDSNNGSFSVHQTIIVDPTQQRSHMTADGPLAGGHLEEIRRCDVGWTSGYILTLGGPPGTNVTEWQCTNQTLNPAPTSCQWSNFWAFPANASYQGAHDITLYNGTKVNCDEWQYWNSNEQYSFNTLIDTDIPVRTAKIKSSVPGWHLWHIDFTDFSVESAPVSDFNPPKGIHCVPPPPDQTTTTTTATTTLSNLASVVSDRFNSNNEEELWMQVIRKRNTFSNNPKSPLDLRVTPAHASRGTGQIRVSVITNVTAPLSNISNFFDYNAPFNYRWTHKYLHSTLKPVRVDGSPTTFEIDGITVEISVPAKGSATIGLMIADPCFAGAAATCFYADAFQTFDRLTTLVNTLVPKLDYWQILGDNFYDRDGHLTQAWYDQISLEVKSTLFATVAGNHDYWGFGSSTIGLDIDQFGNGLMQYYGMDTVSSVQMSTNKSTYNGSYIDFSINPDAKHTHHHIPPLENFFTWFAIGNIGYILYSGGYDYVDSKPYFEQACKWLEEEKPDVAFIAGHWNHDGLGCSDKMDVPDVYNELRLFDGCKEMDEAYNLKYIMGHTHCNEVTANDTRTGDGLGFMVAGQGMEGCANFGIPILETTETTIEEKGRVELIYYNVQDYHEGSDRYEEILKCFEVNGVKGCKDLGTVWLNQSIGDTVWK